MKDFQYITNAHPSYIENLYNDFIKDPSSIDGELRKFFEGFDFAISNSKDITNGTTASAAAAPVNTVQLDKEFNVYQLILAYRRKGHLVAKTNPIRERKDRQRRDGGAEHDERVLGRRGRLLKDPDPQRERGEPRPDERHELPCQDQQEASHARLSEEGIHEAQRDPTAAVVRSCRELKTGNVPSPWGRRYPGPVPDAASASSNVACGIIPMRRTWSGGSAETRRTR